TSPCATSANPRSPQRTRASSACPNSTRSTRGTAGPSTTPSVTTPTRARLHSADQSPGIQVVLRDHDARRRAHACHQADDRGGADQVPARRDHGDGLVRRSEEHTSELQSRFDLVCRLLLEKKKTRASRRKAASGIMPAHK